MSDEDEDNNDLLFSMFDPQVADQMRKQWEEDGKPLIESVHIIQEYDEENETIIVYHEMWYVDDTAPILEEEDEEDEEIIPSKDWYDQAVDRLKNGEI